MKNLFHIAIESQFYDSSGIRKGFEANGYHVTQFNWQHERFDHGTEQMRERCIVKAKESEPSLIFLHCQNAEAFSLKTVQDLQLIAPVVHYTFDIRKDISWYKKLVPKVTITLFGCEEDVNHCKNDGLQNVGYLPSTADFDIYKPNLHLNGQFKHDDVPEIVFIGNDTTGSNLNYPNAQHRRDMVEFMEQEFGKQFKAYGLKQTGGMVDREQEIRIYNDAKIVITHNHFQRKGYCSDRDFRATGCGAFTVHQYFDGVKEMFGYPAVVWSDFSDLKYICKYFLDEKHDRERAELSIREHVHVTQNHTWEKRVRQMLAMMEELKQPQ